MRNRLGFSRLENRRRRRPERGSDAYNNTSGNAPLDYSIEVSSNSTDGTTGSWSTAEDMDGTPVEVAGNSVRSRGHSFSFEGMTWVRLVLTAPQAAAEGANPRPITFDEISVFDVSASGNERPEETWFLMGDSIAQGAFMRDIGAAYFFQALINDEVAGFTPAVISGGIGLVTAE